MVETRSGKMQDPAQERIQAEESAKPQPGATIGRDASSDPVVLNPNIDIPKYDGTEDPRPWIESLEEIGFLYHWADYIISRYAAMNMTGSAKTWLNLHKASFTSWENIKIRLIQDFSLDANKEELRMKLNRMQHWNEPAIRFAEDILVLCNKVDPAMEEETKIEHVIGGLKKEYSFALYLNPPKTTDDLLVVCKKMDYFEKKYRERVEKSRNLYNGPRYSRPQQQSRYVPPTAARNYQTTSRPQAPVSNNYKNDSPPTPRQYRNNFPQPSTPRRPYNPNFVPKPNLQRNTYNKSQEVSKNRTEDGRPICFKCNKPGHVARYCRVKFIRILEEDPADTQEKVEEKCQMNEISEKSGPRLYADSAKDSIVPECSMKLIKALVETEDGEYIIEESSKMFQTNGLRLARSLINVINRETHIWITNPYPRPLKIMKNQTLAFGSSPAKINVSREREVEKNEEPRFQINENLSPKEQKELKQVLERYGDLFSSRLGRTNLAKHRIDTEDAKPIKHKPYRVSAKERDIIKEQIDEMLTEGIIRPSSSPWSFPVILVKKRDGKYRFCVDYRKLNNVTVKDVYPIPRIDEVMDTLQGSTHFSAIDLRSGYWQVEVEERDKEKTAFTTAHGLYEFNVMPFGLCNAPATFERNMENMLGNLRWQICLCYLDDVIIYSPDFPTHLKRLEAVFRCFRESNLRLNDKKCRFAFEELEILGYITSKHGIKPAEHNIKAVRNFPRPKKVKEVQSFLGMCSYYRKFIKDFSKIADPLTNLIKKSVSFTWTERQEEAFQTLKTALLSPPILGHFNPNAPTYVHTDASNIGIGATLVQDIGGEEKVISYLSRTLSKAEQNYSTTEKECLAVVWSMSKLRPYLYGRHFKIVTDHHALCWLKNLKDPAGRLARWALKIQEYDFDIIHKSGKKHLDADGLSRGPLPETDWDEDFERLFLNQITDEEDKFIESVKKNLNGSRRSIAQNFKEEDGCLFKKNPNPEGRAWLLVVPEYKKREIMKEYHNHMSNGHLGVARTMYRIKSKYFWPSMLKDVSEFVKTCHLCQSRKGSNQLPSGLLQPIPPANFPFERIGIDFVGPLPSTKNRKKWIIVLSDYYTRYAETRAVSEATVKEVSKFLVEDIFLRHGAPQYLISDRGSQFTSNLMKEVMKTCKIKHCFTTSYHPQTNGLTERLNRTLINMLSMYVNTDQKNWDEILPFITHAYNTTIQETTGYSPFFLMFGREPTSLLDDRNISVDIDKDDYDEYLKHHLDKINRTRKLVINNTIKTQERMKKNYDKKHMERSYEPGELVAVWTPIRKIGKCEKLLRKYFGPYRILEKLSNVNYLIEPKDNPGQDPLIVHVSRIKPYFERIDEVNHEDSIPRPPLLTPEICPAPSQAQIPWSWRGRTVEANPGGLHKVHPQYQWKAEDPQLTLPRAISIAVISESTCSQVASLNEQKMIEKIEKRNWVKDTIRMENAEAGPSGINPRRERIIEPCKWCGQRHKYGKCPAYGKKCNACGKTNHFSVVCRTKRIRNLLAESEAEESCDEINLNEVAVKTVRSDKWSAVIIINGKKTTVHLDTGAQINVLPHKVINQWPSRPEIRPTSLKAFAYGNTELPIVGKCNVLCQYGEKKGMFEFIVADVEAQTLITGDTCEKLEILRRINHINTDEMKLCSETQKILEQYHEVFQGVGLINSECKIYTKPEYSPVQVPPRRIPTSLGAEVQSELEKMVKQGIVTKIYHETEWSHPMVVVKKKIWDSFQNITYVDDLLIYADTIQEHNKKLKGILEKAKEKNIKFDLTKAQICLTKVRFLGHVISQNGIDPEPNKIDKLITFKRPEDKKSLQRIMGLYNYLGKFIPNLAASTSNIRGILRKNVVWHWGPKQDGEFDHIKECVRNAPSLAHFDKSKMLILQCDASKDAMGAALLQEDRPLAFASASFSDSQKQYSQIEKELLSVYYGCKKFEYLLSGHTFVVQTDHQPLLPLVKKPLSDISPRLQRLVMKLIAFDFKLQYKPGKYLIVADTLSRDTHPMDELPTPFLEDKRMVKMVRVNISDEKLVAMQKDTREDPALAKVIDYVIEGWPICKKDVDEDAKVFFDFRHRLYLWNDLLCIGSAIVIPKTQRNAMLNLLHQSHQGISAIQGLARESLFWPRMSIDIAEKVKNCEICQKHQKSKIRQPLKPFPVPDYPWQTVSLDIFYIQKKPHLLVVDRYSGYPEVFTLDPPTAINVKNKLRETFARFGIPETMMSDNGPPFRSEIMTDFCIRWGIKQLFSSPHLHRSNGLAERNIQTIKNQLIKCRDEGSDPYLAILAYRNTPKNDLPSPAQLCLSRSLRCQIPRITPLYRPYQTNWRSIENAKRKRQSSMKEQYDRNSKSYPKVNVGEDAWCQIHPRETWTPVKISAQADSPQSFEVVTPSGNRLIRNQQFIRPRDGGYEKSQLSSEPITASPEAQHPQCYSPTMGESSTAPIQRSSEETNIDQREGATTSAGIAPEPSGRPRFSRELVKSCEYGNLEEDMIRDQIIEKCYNRQLKEMLLQQDNLNLQRTIEISRMFETAKEEFRVLTNEDMTSMNRVNYKNNFQASNESTVKGPKAHNVYHQKGSTSKKNIFPKSQMPTLNGTERKFYAYGQTSPLPCCGYFFADVSWGERSIKEQIFVIEGKAEPLLGKKASFELEIIKRGTKIRNIQQEVIPKDIYNLIQENINLFQGQGNVKGYSQKITLKENVTSVAQRCRHFPYKVVEAINQELDKMIEDGIIEEVHEASEWISNIVAVPKKGTEEIRLCVDLREVNKAIVRERYPIPTVDNILQALQGAKVFAKLDAKKGFWQIELDEKSRPLTTFITPRGCYRFCKIPFGLCSAPEAFQKAMNSILSHLEGVVCYIDDVIVYAQSIEQLYQRLKKVFERFQQVGLKLNKSKCKFALNELEILGHIVSKDGIRPDPKKIESVLSFSKPENVDSLKSFLGTCGFLRKFIPDFSKLAEPLNNLTRKDIKWKWSKKEEDSFRKLKEALTKNPCLAYFDMNAPTEVIADASPVGLGAVLLQRQNDGSKKPVAYASRSLTNVERRYSQIEKEALGCVWAVEHFNDYLWGNKFVLKTDHKPLIYMLNPKKATVLPPRIERLSWRLQPYDYEIEYLKGKQNIADIFSRKPLTNISCENIVDDYMWKKKTYKKNCYICEVNQPLTTIPIPPRPWYKVGVDLVGPIDSKYILTLIDYYSSFPEAIIIHDISSKTIISKLKEIFARYGFPIEIVSDNGLQFVSKDTEQFFMKSGIKHIRVSPYYPKSNGKIERFHRYLKKQLISVKLQGKDWKEELQCVLMAYRSTPHPSTGKTPALLLFSREIRNKLNDINDNDALMDKEVMEHNQAYKERMKKYADSKNKALPHDFKKGNIVYVANTEMKSKLTPNYDNQRFIILETISPNSFKLVNTETGSFIIRNAKHLRHANVLQDFNKGIDLNTTLIKTPEIRMEFPSTSRYLPEQEATLEDIVPKEQIAISDMDCLYPNESPNENENKTVITRSGRQIH
ncbi:hypothetical protein LAZ67_5001654, partial [Cordylochernes scorpioides]